MFVELLRSSIEKQVRKFKFQLGTETVLLREDIFFMFKVTEPLSDRVITLQQSQVIKVQDELSPPIGQ